MQLEKGRIEVFITWPDQVKDRLPDCEQILSAQEREKARRFAFEKDQTLSLMARAQLRWLISEFSGVPARDLAFTASAAGKPQIRPGTPADHISFNVSHTRGLVVSALTLETPLGVDAEGLDRKIDLTIARRYFSPDEAGQIEAAPAPDRAALFLRFWTLKEAFIKARGQGLSLGLDAVRFDLSPDHIGYELEGSEKDPCWQFFQFCPDTGSVAALAVYCKNPLSVTLYNCVPFGDILPVNLPIIRTKSL